MANFYVLISHYEKVSRDNFYLTKQLPDGKLSIGWGEVNPIGSTPAKIKQDIKNSYPTSEGTNNPWNGEESLSAFASLLPGDVIFVRGDAKILDIAVVTGPAIYEYGNGHDDPHDYCSKVPFVPLLDNIQAGIPTKEIPEPQYSNVLQERGQRLVMRKINEADAIVLLKTILSTL